MVFLFGSFTEDEANSFKSSPLEFLPDKKKRSPAKPIKENGYHVTYPPSPVVKQNGHLSPSKVAENSTDRVPEDRGVEGNAFDSFSFTRGHTPEKHPAGRAPVIVTEGACAQGFSNSLSDTAVRTPGALVPSQNGDQTGWLLVSVPDDHSDKIVCATGGESSSESGSAKGAKGDQEELSPIVVGTAGSEIEPILERNKSADDNSEDVSSKHLPKSWAALVAVPGDSNAVPKQSFASGPRGRGSAGPVRPNKSPPVEDIPIQVTALSGELWLRSLREAEISGRRFQPRGLINTGNSCFLNSTVQAMLSCSAFTHLLQVLKARSIPQTGFPTLRAFVDFSGEFGPPTGRTLAKSKRDGDGKGGLVMDVGKPFAPAMFDVVLQSFTPDQPPRGTGRNRVCRQEDAQEFLSFVIDRMHEEILHLQGKNSPSFPSVSPVTLSEDGDWEMVGPKNRSAVTRTHTFSESAITDIFGGQLRSVVKTKGNKASATVQPFLVLHLDIVPEAVHSLEDALRFFAAPESLEGYKPSTAKAGEVVSASKSVKIQTLPRVLILHLMRFSYGSNGSSKLHKPVLFPLELTLGRELLASTTTSGNEVRRYELVATISHHGKDPSVGHYTADSKQANGQWLHFDDGVVSGVLVNRVLQEQAYVLFYKRLGSELSFFDLKHGGSE